MKLAITASIILLLALSGSALAQTPAPTTGWTLQVRLGADVTSETNITLNGARCDLAPEAAATVPLINPTTVYWDDPARAGRRCSADITQFIRDLPVASNYSGYLAAVSSTMQAPNNRSAFALAIPNFNVAPIFGPPAVPTNVKLR